MSFIRKLGYFPFCINNSSLVGIGTDYPLGASLDQVMKWYWRVKKWIVDIGYSDSSSTVTYSSPPIEFDWWDIPVLNPVSDEKELMCPLVERQRYMFLSSGGFGIQLHGMSKSPEEQKINSGMIWPKLYGGWLAADNSGLWLQPATDFIQSTNAQFTIDGVTINNVWMYYTYTSAFMTMTPSEYWPYDPDDGLGPIYDTSTGAQLRPFPSA